LERTPITREGYEDLKRELEYLKKVERPMNIKAIEEARSHGDLTENAEYEAAKDRQAFIEGRLGELGYKLASADIIDPQTLQVVEYQLVGPDESDVEKGRISVSSPLGKAIVGKKPGDEITLVAPSGKRHYELVEIQ